MPLWPSDRPIETSGGEEKRSGDLEEGRKRAGGGPFEGETRGGHAKLTELIRKGYFL